MAATGVVLVTGANSGLGLVTCIALAQMPGTSEIILACRSRARAEEAIAILVKGTSRPSDFFRFLHFDSACNDSVRSAVASLKASNTVLDRILLNAGGMGSREASGLTKAGSTEVMAMNVVGHALFVEQLIAANLIAPGARIIFSSSESIVGMGPFPKPTFDPPTKDTVAKHMNNTLTGQPLKWMGPGYMGVSGYGCAKAIGTMYFQHLARLKPDVYIASVSPGATKGTGAMKSSSGWFKCLGGFLATFMMHSVEVGAQRYVDALTSETYPSDYPSGACVASFDSEGATGKVCDYAKVDTKSKKNNTANFQDVALQEQAYQAVQQFFV